MTVPSNEATNEEANTAPPATASSPIEDTTTTKSSSSAVTPHPETALDQYVMTAEDLEDPGQDNNRDPLDPRELKFRHWEQSPFAVGCVNVTWHDDRKWFRPAQSQALDRNPQLFCSAYVCGCLGAGRVGNLAVLAQMTEEYDHVDSVDEETGERRTSKRKRPKLLCVVGPFWPINLFLTYPLILGISFWTGWVNMPDAPIGVAVTWSFCTFLLIFSLAMVACRDPGVLYRYRERPPDGEDWKWNDQAKTFRPLKARFDPECQVVVEGFDHTCPWTGTAIGSRNMFWFRIFVTMVPLCIAYSVVLHVFL